MLWFLSRKQFVTKFFLTLAYHPYSVEKRARAASTIFSYGGAIGSGYYKCVGPEKFLEWNDD